VGQRAATTQHCAYGVVVGIGVGVGRRGEVVGVETVGAVVGDAAAGLGAATALRTSARILA
jgi:hypothetical protein